LGREGDGREPCQLAGLSFFEVAASRPMSRAGTLRKQANAQRRESVAVRARPRTSQFGSNPFQRLPKYWALNDVKNSEKPPVKQRWDLLTLNLSVLTLAGATIGVTAIRSRRRCLQLGERYAWADEVLESND
jgi:hypothetical protein